MKRFFKQKNNGFTLVETLVAVSIFTMSILGLMSVLAGGIADTSYAKNKMVATYLAQEGIEYVRNLRDTAVLYNAVDPQTGWNSFITSKTINYPTSSDFSSFTRENSIREISANEVQISTTVSWKQGSGEHSITFSENLFNWVE